MSSPHPEKRRKIQADWGALSVSQSKGSRRSTLPDSYVRRISPPLSSRDQRVKAEQSTSPHTHALLLPSSTGARTVLRSPFQLTRIRDLDAEDNVDTVSIRDIICDPLIREIWCFNYLFDPKWIMSNLDPDTKPTTNLILIHGSWQAESDNRKRILEACSKYENVSQVTAYLPDRYGTHHSKMMILFRHDETAEVVIHTANMIEQDWRNMTQGVWKTGPLAKGGEPGDAAAHSGSGQRLKYDLITYLGTYTDRSGRSKLSKLTDQLTEYDFNRVKGALVASVPSRFHPLAVRPEKALWGWPSLRRVLRAVPVQNRLDEVKENVNKQPEIIVQVSSIASLGPSDSWLSGTLFKTLLECSLVRSPKSSYDTSEHNAAPEGEKDSILLSKLSIVYPTPATIRNSLDGYASGGSIHMRLDSGIAKRQLGYLRPRLYDWASSSLSTPAAHRDAGRSLAAPHIKTYIRYATRPSSSMDLGSPIYIDWALLTSANLSTQAWGSSPGRTGEVWVQSYEIGILVWPSLYHSGADPRDAKMLATFGNDMPDPVDSTDGKDWTIVGLRVPYSLPLRQYAATEKPWCLTSKEGYSEPDRFGMVLNA